MPRPRLTPFVAEMGAVSAAWEDTADESLRHEVENRLLEHLGIEFEAEEL